MKESLKEKIRYGIKNTYGNLLFYLFRVFPVDKKKIFFSSFNGKACEGNPRYISEYLSEHRKDIKQVWGIRPNVSLELKGNIKQVKWASIKMIYEMATSNVWIDSHNLPAWVIKRKNQFFVQCWHGGLGVKKIINDFAGKTKRYENDVAHSVEMADLFVSNSTFLTNLYRNSFKYKGKIGELGFPKNDIFYSNLEKKEKIRKDVFTKLNINTNKKMVLYAPTFRENKRMNVYGINFSLLKEAVEKRFKGDFVVAFRLHPEIRHLSKEIQEKNPECLDVSYFDNMQDLIIATDIFISDYSSGIFDFASLRRPGFLFATDIESYEKEHGLYYDLRELPFPLAVNNEELKDKIINFDEELYKKELEQFFIKVGLKDNVKSTEKVSEIIEDYIYNDKK